MDHSGARRQPLTRTADHASLTSCAPGLAAESRLNARGGKTGSGGTQPRPPRSRARSVRAALEAELDAYDGAGTEAEEEAGAGRGSAPASRPGSLGRSPGLGSRYGASPPHRSVVIAPRTHPSAADEEEADLCLAVALSLSLSPAQPPPQHPSASAAAGRDPLSFESLSELEDVRLTAPPGLVAALPRLAYDEAAHGSRSCPVCMCDAAEGDVLVQLPCGHALHEACGVELLLGYSKRCPECKQPVDEA